MPYLEINVGGCDPTADEDSTVPFSTRLTTPSCSGIHALPTELISLILVAVVTLRHSPRHRSMWTGLDRPDHLDSSITHFPLIAQLVCRRWREISLLTPGLWTHLNLMGVSGDILTQYLDSSGILPLEVYYGPPPLHIKYINEDLIDDNVAALHDHAHRIHRLHIVQQSTGPGFYSPENRLPDLENLLELTMEGPGDSDTGDQYRRMMLKSPRLRSLYLYKHTFGGAATRVFTNLEDLRVVAPGGPFRLRDHQLVAALQECPNLRALELGQQPLIEQPSTQQTITTHTVILGALEQLTLWGYTSGQLRLVLDLIQAPKLKALIIRKHVESSSRTAGGTLAVRFPVLRRLEIDACSDLCLEIAEQVPTIKHLRLLHDNKGTALEHVDNCFNSLASHWRTLSRAMPLETVETRGVRVSSLLSLLGEDRLKILPSLHKVTISHKDALSLGDVGGNQGQRADLKRLASLVTTSVRGVWTVRNGAHPLEGVDRSTRLESWRMDLHRTAAPSGCREWRRKGYYLENPIDQLPPWADCTYYRQSGA